MKSIFYKKGYKYQLGFDYKTHINIYPKMILISDYISLDIDGTLFISKGYAWDGPSGITIDTKSFMRGSLIHDGLYQLMREGLLPIEFREQADKELRKACLEDNMCKIRVWYVYKCVRSFSDFAADTKNKKEILEAP